VTGDPYSRHQPIGWWLKHLDGLLTVAFERLLEGEGLGGPHWRVLNAVAGGVGTTEQVEAAFIRLGAGGAAEARAAVTQLVTAGWLGAAGGRLALTEVGAAGRDRLMRAQRAQRERLTAGITPEHYRLTVDTLRRMARNIAG
jgi:hypothetical protein